MEQTKNRSTYFKLAILWLAILLLGSFWLTVKGTSDLISMAVIPQTPREGEPVVATFKLNNPASESMVIQYQLLANGELLKDGSTTVPPYSHKTYKYAYENPLLLGQQVNFVVKTQSELGSQEKVLSLPSYPPQVWSSFVSFASFSTSLMSSMSTIAYYQSSFGRDTGLNLGIIVSAVLIALLIFLELPFSPIRGETVAILGRLRIRLSTVTWTLLIIFMGMVFTKVAMIIAS